MSVLLLGVYALVWVMSLMVTLALDMKAMLSDTQSWGLLLGIVTPWATALVQQPQWTERTRSLVGAGAAVLVGLVTCLANGTLSSGSTVLTTVAIVLVASQTAYNGLWKHVGAKALERATSKVYAPEHRRDEAAT